MGSTLLGTAALSGSAGTATATLMVSASQLSTGTATITAQYSGDTAYSGASASVTLTVAAVPSGPPSITGLTNGASFKQVYAPGMILSVFGSQLATATASAGGVPLPSTLSGVSATINGVAAPLYYVSPGQLNIQVPYQTPLNTNVQLTLNNNGQTSSSSLRLAAAAPGIFADQSGSAVPDATAIRGQVVTLYITGAGAVSPAVTTGAAPAAGTPVAISPSPPRPLQ